MGSGFANIAPVSCTYTATTRSGYAWLWRATGTGTIIASTCGYNNGVGGVRAVGTVATRGAAPTGWHRRVAVRVVWC